MLKLEQRENVYEVRVESNNKLIGNFIPSDDGFYYFAPYGINDGALWADYTLLEIGRQLRIINKPWSDKINEYFEDHIDHTL
jgi:hypothetical protein